MPTGHISGLKTFSIAVSLSKDTQKDACLALNLPFKSEISAILFTFSFAKCLRTLSAVVSADKRHTYTRYIPVEESLIAWIQWVLFEEPCMSRCCIAALIPRFPLRICLLCCVEWWKLSLSCLSSSGIIAEARD